MKHKIVSLISTAILAIGSILFWKESWYLIFVDSVITIYLIFTIYGSFQIRFNYFINSINKGVKEGISFSFYDGPDPETTPQILEILREQNIKATFFLIGKKAERFPELIRIIDKEGHCIGNHSYSHINSIGFFSTEKLIADIKKCSSIIEQITGKKILFFRPPFGITNPRFSRALKKLNLISIGWSGRSFDTVAKSKTDLLQRVKKVIRQGVILLFHDTQKVTVDTLPAIIEYCKEKGIKIVPLQELIDKKPYETI